MNKKLRNILITAVLGLAFTFSAMAQNSRPSITSLQPTSGPIGTQLTITGTNFTQFEIQNDNTVKFGVGYIKNIKNDSTIISFIVPDSLDLCPRNNVDPCPMAFPRVWPGKYNVSVVNSNGTSNVVSFTVTSQKVCTQEAKQCPNGSYVSRTGPNCEFAECPVREDKAYRKKIEDLSKCGPQPGAPGNWVCKDGGWKIEQNNIAETRRMELKDKISKLRDEKKKQIATRLDEQMARLNVKWTDHFNKVLNQLSDVLAKVELRVDKAQIAGKDVSAVRTAIQDAKNAIATARTAVETQAKKTYTATFTSEDKLGAAFKAVREQLKTDLFGLRDGAMKSAREAVQSAHQSLKGLNF